MPTGFYFDPKSSMLVMCSLVNCLFHFTEDPVFRISVTLKALASNGCANDVFVPLRFIFFMVNDVHRLWLEHFAYCFQIFFKAHNAYGQ